MANVLLVNAIRRVARAIVLPVALVTVWLSPTAAHASASITNGGSVSMTICHNAQSESVCASGVGILFAGENSVAKYGWSDTDMIRIGAGCSAQRKTQMPPTYEYKWYTFAVAGSSARWFKVTDNYGGQWRLIC